MSLALRRDTDEWRDARRNYITSTDLPIILGLSPYRAEADLAAEKLGEAVEEIDARRRRLMDMGKRLESVVLDTDEEEHGVRIRKVSRFLVHPTIEWAATSLDGERVGEKVIVEAKTNRGGKRFEDPDATVRDASGKYGLPQDIEAQVRWQMGVARYPKAHVAVLVAGSDLICFDVDHDAETFDGLVTIASDFRDRLEAGGPFAESSESLKRRYPTDNGAEMVADQELDAAVHGLRAVREQIKALEADEERLEKLVKTRMGEFAVLRGPDFAVTWKRTADRHETDWKSLATGLLTTIPEPDRDTVLSLHSATKPGFRPFRVRFTGDD